MSNFTLHIEHPREETPVSNIFIDEYMPEANGAYVKIYLYLLRCIQSGVGSLSVPSIADCFEHTETDVHRALAYWEKMQLLRLEYDEAQTLTGICLLEPKSRKAITASPLDAPCQNEIISESNALQKTQQEPAAPPKTDYTPDQLDKFQEQKEIRQLLFISEQYIGKTLSPQEISTILYFYDGLHFSFDLIEYLIEYCVTKGHKSLRYMESVALAWHKEGYQTASQAKKECSLYSKASFAVLKAFGIKGRSPVDSEVAFINKWMKTLGFSQELVIEACNRTMAAIHQPSFEYADSILNNWHANKVQSLKDIAALDAQRAKKAAKSPTGNGASNSKHPAAVENTGNTAVKKAAASNRFHNFKQREYDFAELEKQLINH